MKYKCSLQSHEDNTKMTEKTDMIDVRAHLRSVDPMKLKLLIEFFHENNADMTDVSTARLIKFAFG